MVATAACVTKEITSMGFHNAAEHDILFFLYLVIGLTCVVGTTGYVAYRGIARLFGKNA
jgi:hypothetical protein